MPASGAGPAPRHLLYNNTLASPYHPLPHPHSQPASSAHPYANAAPKRSRTRSHPTPRAAATGPYLTLTPPAHATATPLSATRSHPSLDHIASRAELRSPLGTPRRGREGPANLWDSMPSSPPEEAAERNREYVYGEYARAERGRKTLEWACASAGARRGKDASRRRRSVGGDADMEPRDQDSDATDETADAHEAVTPSSSYGQIMGSAKTTPTAGDIRVKGVVEDEDMMAAYVLCGLARR